MLAGGCDPPGIDLTYGGKRSRIAFIVGGHEYEVGVVSSVVSMGRPPGDLLEMEGFGLASEPLCELALVQQVGDRRLASCACDKAEYPVTMSW
jgi:hypothetical protein